MSIGMAVPSAFSAKAISSVPVRCGQPPWSNCAFALGTAIPGIVFSSTVMVSQRPALASTPWWSGTSPRRAGRRHRSPERRSVRISSGTPPQPICCEPALTSTRSAPGLATSRSTPPTFTPRPTWKRKPAPLMRAHRRPARTQKRGRRRLLRPSGRFQRPGACGELQSGRIA